MMNWTASNAGFAGLGFVVWFVTCTCLFVVTAHHGIELIFRAVAGASAHICHRRALKVAQTARYRDAVAKALVPPLTDPRDAESPFAEFTDLDKEELLR